MKCHDVFTTFVASYKIFNWKDTDMVKCNLFIRYVIQQLKIYVSNFFHWSLLYLVFFTQLFKNFSSLIIWVVKNKFFLLAINSVRIIFIVLLESSKIYINVLMCTVGWCRKFLQCPLFFFSERSEPMITQQMVYGGLTKLTNCIFYTLSVFSIMKQSKKLWMLCKMMTS